MDTKWKNRIITVAWLLLFTFGIGGFISTLYMLFSGSDYFKSNYFQTEKFESELHQYIQDLITFKLNDQTPDEMKKAITVTNDEIHEHRYQYGNLSEQIENIKGQYESRIQDALAANSQEVANLYIAERDRKIEDITNNFKSDDYVKAKIIKEKEQQIDDFYREIENKRSDFLTSQTDFKYYLKDRDTKKTYTNVKVKKGESVSEYFRKQKMLFLVRYPNRESGYLTSESYNSTLPINQSRKYEGMIAIPEFSSNEQSTLAEHYRSFEKQQMIFFSMIICSMIALVLSLYMNKKLQVTKFNGLKKWQVYYNRTPIDVCLFFFAITGLITFLSFMRFGDFYIFNDVRSSIYNFITEYLLSFLLTSATLVQTYLLKGRVTNRASLKENWQKSVLYMIYDTIKQSFLIRKNSLQLLLVLIITFATGAGAMLVFMRSYDGSLITFYVFCCLFIGLPTLLFIFRRASYVNRIIVNTSEMAHGNLEVDLPIEGKSSLAELATAINTLKQGVKVSQKAQIKSERLKTELITNVSHDLRTPLTSIITYTELLKSQNLSKEDHMAYVEIIDRKSKRLKVLIDDLFEASKMASGNMELTKEKVDLVQLMQQALAEYNEAIDQSSLQFRVTTPDTPVNAEVDGQKMWRVFDNLIGNILKYSLENTRVYISMKTTPDHQVVITFKNVTKYELGENTDELFERFKRGDTSRNTEGSGLGLAIAKSIVDLHGGNLDLEIDGDLFKVTVVL